MRFTLDTDLPVVEREAWDGGAAKDRILSWAGYDDAQTDEDRDEALNRAARLFLFRNDDSSAKDDLVAPCGDIVDGEPSLVTSGMRYALAAVNGARGGISAPEELLQKARQVLERLLDRQEARSADEILYSAKHLQIKRTQDGRIIAKGYAIVWDSVDLEGEQFTRDVDLGEELLGIKTYPMLYEHGMHPEVGLALLGRVVKTERDEIGWLIEAELDRHSKYLDLIRALAARDALGLSTGAVGHLVEREGKVIKRWAVVEVSLTPTPAEPKTLGVELAREIGAKALSEPKAQTDVAEDEAASAASDVLKAHTSEEVKSMYATQVSEIKTFRDFLSAVKSGAAKALGVSTGPQGGFLVPEEFVADLLRMTSERSIVLPRAFKVNTVGAIRQPVIDLSKGSSDTLAWFGGVKFEWLAEGATIPETEPTFKQYTLRGIAFAGLTRVANRLLDAPGFETTLRQMMSEAMSAYLDYFFIRGDGAGKPLGILNAPARVNVARNSGGDAFEPVDAVMMYSRFKQVGIGSAVWLVHPTIIPDLAEFNVGNVPVWAPNWREGFAGTLLGIPVVVSEYCSQAGTAGDVILVDWAAYAVQLANEIEIAVSEHAYFAQDQTAFRVMAYADGQPRIQDKAKLIGTSVEVSPFVVLQ